MNLKKISNQNIIYITVLVLILGGIDYAAVKFTKPKTNSNSTAAAGAAPSNGRFGGHGQDFNRGDFKPLTGTVSSINGQTIIMKADDGSSKNITVASTTRISKPENGQRASLTILDIKVGDTINIMADDTTVADITPRMIFIGTFSPPQNGSYPNNNFNNNSVSPSLSI